MSHTEELVQEDISYLFWLDYGRVREIPVLIADRLISHRLVQQVGPLQGAHVPEHGELYIGVSESGRELIIAISKGLDDRFRIPAL
jgi:hypothetical protein